MFALYCSLAALGLGFALGKGHGPIMLKAAIWPLKLLRRRS